MTGGANAHETTSEESNGVATDFVSEGIIGAYTNTSGVAPATGAFAVNAQGTPDMTVAVSSGVAYVTGTPTSQNSQTFRVYNSSSSNVTISANSSGSTKYDWVYIKLDATLLANPTLAGTTTGTLVTSRSTSSGTDDGTPPTYGYPVAVVTVANGASSITNAAIRDIRVSAGIGSTASETTGWIDTGLPAVSSATNNGNRSYNITFASTVASLLSPGMRLRTTRTVTAPTQCADLEASSSQYFSKASATGFATGTTWTIKAKIKPESYANMVIWALDDGTNVIQMYLNSSGQIIMSGGTSAAQDLVTSYQSVALGKWQEVTGSITIGTPTGEIRLDDAVIPSFVTASAATTVTINGDETAYIGRNSVGLYFDGKIAQVAVFNAVIPDATLKTYSSQTMTGSETNCKGFWSLNGVLTDSSASANTVTGSGGAVATNADSPFGQDSNGVTAGTTDYALVMKVSTTTATVQVPEGCTIPTSGGVSAVAYSTATSPFGFTLDKGRWEILTLLKGIFTQSSPVSGTWYNLTTATGVTGGSVLSVPTGTWDLGYYASVSPSTGAVATADAYTTLSTANNTESDTNFTSWFYSSPTGATANFVITTMVKRRSVSLSSATPYYMNNKVSVASITTLATRGDGSPVLINALPAGI